MNQSYKAYLRRTRQTPAMKLTDAINRLVTLENARAYAATSEQSIFLCDLLAGADVRSTLTTDEGERNVRRLERKLDKLNR